MVATEEIIVEIIRNFFYEIINCRDSEDAILDIKLDLVDELELTKKEAALLDKLLLETLTFSQAMVLLEKAMKQGEYWLYENEVKVMDEFLNQEKYNRMFRYTKQFIKNQKPKRRRRADQPTG